MSTGTGGPPRRPPTFEQMFALGEATLWQRLQRDWRLAKFLLQTFIMWATVGRRVRREWRTACAEGRPFVLDEKFKRSIGL